ncbi:MAG: 1-deoxy-D-xylulose-5-phosphate synthase, partial [Oscillospiraceae bacterium]
MGYSVLDLVNSSDDVSKLKPAQLKILCAEVREFLIDKVSKTGGHLSANLGTVEIITAMHYCFSMPQDEFVFDVGHQSYTHKIYTGRKEGFDKLRKLDGLSGFPSPAESESDAFIAGHGSTSISVAIGLATAKKIKNEPGFVIAVIGDGAFTGGLAYEGLNNVGKDLDNLIVILNDNKMSISKNVGSMSTYLSTLRASQDYLTIKKTVSDTLDRIPYIGSSLSRTITSSKSLIRRSLYHSTFFEEMGFVYHKVDDGNDIEQMIAALNAAKTVDGSVFIHAVTVKGKGFTPAEENPGAFHGVGSFNADSVTDPDVAPSDSFSTVFGRKLSDMANSNINLCAITAAMKYGTGLQFFYKEHRRRFFDVGMAEAHAVTFAAGLAKQGLQPVVCLYSTFMQRALDQFLHDVLLLKLNVLFAIDRAGLVPGDGETHQGIYDIGIFSNYDNIMIVCPTNYAELVYWQEYLINNVTGPKVIRYARGGQEPQSVDYKCTFNEFDIVGEDKNTAIVCYGRQFNQAVTAKRMLAEQGISVSIIKLNVVNPIPSKAISVL